jgi:hypothetical protein
VATRGYGLLHVGVALSVLVFPSLPGWCGSGMLPAASGLLPAQTPGMSSLVGV